MATRFYLPDSGAAAVSPAYDAAWNQTGEANRIALQRKTLLATLDALADRTVTVPITTTENILSRQYVSEPLPGAYISGTVSLVIRLSEGDVLANSFLALIVKLVSNDGGTLGTTLFSNMANDTEIATTAATRIVNAQALTPATSNIGDRLIVEIGVGVSSPGLGSTAVHRYGTNAASDFALTTALTTDLNPYIEFSQDLWGTVFNNFQAVRVGSGLSTGERIR